MPFFIGLAILIAVCVLAVWLLPTPKYGQLRCGCTGRALQAAMEREEAEKARKENAGLCHPPRQDGRSLCENGSSGPKFRNTAQNTVLRR